MIRIPRRFLCYLALLLALTNCHDKAWDDYYARPGWLAGPLYQQLKAKGKFNLYITCLEKTGYSNILGRSGYFTLFAPNDSAFNAFLKEKGYTSVNDLDSLTLHNIIDYSIINNGYNKVQLAAYQDYGNSSWGVGLAYKRKTFCKDIFYTDNNMKIVNHNQKYIPYFLDSYLSTQRLTASDYDFFYPGAGYHGFNVADAHVINSDIVAENGYIQEVDKVLLPLPGVDQYLGSQSDYSTFKGMLDMFVTLMYDTTGILKYSKYTGSSDIVYSKIYSNLLICNPTKEDFNSNIPNASQTTGWTLLIPDNASLDQFVSNRLLKYYSSVNQIYSDNSQLLADFINIHNSITYPSLWPKDLSLYTNNAIDKSNILTHKICSNGIFYGINKVLSHDFTTVFSEVYLNPACRVMSEWIKSQPTLKEQLLGKSRNNIDAPYTIFIPTDSAILPMLRSYGFVYDKTLRQVQSTDIKGNRISAWDDPLVGNLLKMHIIAANITDISGNGFYQTLAGEYVGFNSNTVFSAGNNEKSELLTCSSPMNEVNGTTFSILSDKAIRIPTKSAGYYLATNSQYSSFFNYLKNSGIFNAADTTIKTVFPGVNYTYFIPDNNAIANAGLPSATATDSASVSIIKKFLLYHIVSEKMIFTDGKVTGDNFVTKAQTNTTGIPVYATVKVSVQGNSIVITDMQGNPPANVTSANNLAKQSVIHLIDNVLKY